MNKGDTYHNTCNDQPSTWTIKAIEGDKVTVHNIELDRYYTIDGRIFEDTMRALGFELQGEKATKYILKSSITPIVSEHDTFNQALEVGQKIGDWPFQIELGGMICATWGPLSGLRVMTEYQQWAQDQQYILAKVEGSYP